MPKKQRFIKHSSSFSRALVATALLSNGVFQFVAPVLAEGTAAGQSISNTATATYEDPNDSTTTINATSNTVTVIVAEVTGINILAKPITDTTGGTVQVGDLLIYNFTITNTGNDPTTFRIPNAATVTGPGTVSGILPNGGTTSGALQFSTDNGTTWVNLSGTEAFTPSINPNGTVLVRVPVTVTNAAVPGQTIDVTLGDTSNNTINTQNQQNVLLQPTGTIGAKDVYTKDNLDSPVILGEAVGVIPIEQEKEAAATGTANVGNKDYALATLLKTLNTHNNNSTPSIVTDDIVTYGLSLNVANTAPAGTNITPADLKGIENIDVDGTAGTYILISDAIPKGTDLNAVPTTTNGTNWEAVYTTEAVTINANAAKWKRFSTNPLTTATELATATRVGFINKAPLTSIAPGTTVTGFSITVKVESTATAPLNIANIAQLFGGTNTSNTPGTLPVYEESGDNQPSNYDGTVFPGTDSNGDGVPDTMPTAVVEDGYIDDSTDLTNTGTDTNNDNTGTGSLGEANVLIINTSSLLNGPNGQPGALGPTNNNNTDFTNKSSAVPPNTAPGTKIDPSAVTFTNTFTNGGSSDDTVTLVPTPPAVAGDLPADTKVTITYATQTAIYTYNGTSFSLTNGTAISIPSVAPNTPTNYSVSVDLPADTALSTDTGKGYPVPITATIGGTTSNITIDRVYTGFLKLVKLSRVLDANGNNLTGDRAGQSDFETTPVVGSGSPIPRTPLPGEIIEYQIRYKNIAAEDNTNGANNGLLNVSKLVITEDGTLSTAPNDGKNNWAKDNDGNGIIDTSNIVGSAVDSAPGDVDITYFSGSTGASSASDITGTTPATDVTKYVNTLKTTVQIAPGVQRTFTFRRKVN
ncbi:hypothetical protein H6G33_35835 [Calothrix sp. FACHB-1219]|uniref:beta strand repeat-containing protein n=1 Tax=unclassified Calothrix TaxID=2619626 RepID=UPI00168490B2|nr:MULTISPECIES: hypothetical protein [unclassified Calothrix]MBD2207701.1 hypothetical protein [Calothrix sp. FACHB-168]MBD2222305.1 hypothetical protein [Calothrix sp. FACHB-1219]